MSVFSPLSATKLNTHLRKHALLALASAAAVCLCVPSASASVARSSITPISSSSVSGSQSTLAQPQRGVMRPRQVVEATAEVQAGAVPLALLRVVQVPAVLALPRVVQVLGALIPAVLALLHDVTLGWGVLTLVQEVLITTTAITTITTAITPTMILTMTPTKIRLTTIRPAIIVTVASLTIIPAIARNSKTWILGLYLLP